jgi:hypothetical protein
MRSIPRTVAWIAALTTAMPVLGCARGVGPLVGRGEPAYVAGLDVRARAEMRVGAVTGGYVQSGIGGQPGTSSPKRPTYDELDVGTVLAPSGDLRFAFGRHRVHAGATYWILHGEDVLREDLTTHGDTYVAGTSLSSETEFLSSWLAWGYAFPLGGTPGRLTFVPGVGLYMHSQRYSVSGDGRSSGRDFNVASPMLDAELIWHPGGRIHVSGELKLVLDQLLGSDTPTTMVEAAVRLHLDLWRDANVFLGVGVTSIDHYDDQALPNDSELEVVPWFSLGCEFRF